jgi:alkylhydroperoxidase family enzyme
MARVSLVDDTGHPELAELIGQIKSGRRGALLNIYKLLLHSPPLAATWLDHMSAVRWQTSLSGRVREIVVIRIAHLHRCAYVLQQHVPDMALAEGLTLPECDGLMDWKATKLFSAHERAVLAYADAMVTGPDVTEDVFESLRKHFNERELVELTVLIGSYIMHNRVFNALKVDLEPKQT